LLSNGRVLITAGFQFSGFDTVPLANVESFDPANGNWTAVNPMTTPRKSHTATLLPSGNVLITGGQIDSGNVTTNGTEVFNPTNGTWTNASPLTLSSSTYTTTLLDNGEVLALGGNETNNAQMYDPATGSWTNVTPIPGGRSGHTATLLADGRVLIAGGGASTNVPLSGAVFDPKNGSWTNTGPLNMIRFNHTGTLLSDGRVLIAGGRFQYLSINNVLTNAEIFDPVSGNWTNTGPLNTAREIHTATLLSDGRVLVVGGYNDSIGILNSAELYNPSTGLWTVTAPLNKRREFHTATLLPNGKVLVAGGAAEVSCGSLFCVNIFTNSAELFDPVNGAWTLTAPLNAARGYQTATLLPSGKVLIAGGATNGFLGIAAPLASAELHDVGLGFNLSVQPQITSANSLLNLGNSLSVTGSGFRGVSESSGGNTQNSASDCPIVQLRAIESGRVLWLQTASWSTNSYLSTPVTNFPTGFAFATVFVNGIPSTSRIVQIDSAALPTTIILTDITKLPGGGFQFGFTNTAGATFTAFATTNLSISSSNWTALGDVSEISSGHFQFTDSQAANLPQRFYQVRSP
jgi:N-acetylneuraminic acid mutarotase